MDYIKDILARVVESRGLIVVLIYLAFVIFGKVTRTKPDTRPTPGHGARPASRARGSGTPRPTPFDMGDLFGGAAAEPATSSRRARGSERDTRFGSAFDYGSDELFGKEEGTEWGKTKFGFDDDEWGTSFGEKKSSEPIIYTGDR